MRQTTYMITAAMAAVIIKVATVTPMILPAFFMESMLAMAEAMEQNTMGTTMQNIRLMNTVPRGSSTLAPGSMISPWASFTAGHTAPTMQPPMMPISMQIIKP